MSSRTFVTRSEVGDSVFINFSIHNASTATKQLEANIQTILQQPIIENPSEYTFSVIRVEVPSDAIPIFVFEAAPFPNTDINLGIYTITIEYNGQSSAPFPIYFEPTTLIPPIVPVFSAENPKQLKNDPYYNVTSYQQLCRMLNTTLEQVIALSALILLPLTDVHAYSIYSPNNQLFSILGTANMFSFYNMLDPDNVRIWFSTPLAKLFSSFNYFHNGFNRADGRDEAIIVADLLSNSAVDQDGFNPNIPDGYYQMQQEYLGDANLEELQRVLVKSPSFGGVTPTSEIQIGSRGQYDNIIFDLIPVVSTANGSYRSKLQYFLQSAFIERYMSQQTPLVSISFNFLWEGNDPDSIRPILLNPGRTLRMLTVFKKKSKDASSQISYEAPEIMYHGPSENTQTAPPASIFKTHRR